MKVYTFFILLLCVIVASAQRDYDVRLAEIPGADHQGGRLEIYLSGAWGSVCATNFNTQEGNVACKQLGYRYGVESMSNTQIYGGRSQMIYLDYLSCSGYERNLKECGYPLGQRYRCSDSQALAIICRRESSGSLGPPGTNFEPGGLLEDNADLEVNFLRELLREEEAQEEKKEEAEAEKELQDADDALAKKSLEAMVDLLDRLKNK